MPDPVSVVQVVLFLPVLFGYICLACFHLSFAILVWWINFNLWRLIASLHKEQSALSTKILKAVIGKKCYIPARLNAARGLKEEIRKFHTLSLAARSGLLEASRASLCLLIRRACPWTLFCNKAPVRSSFGWKAEVLRFRSVWTLKSQRRGLKPWNHTTQLLYGSHALFIVWSGHIFFLPHLA